ncbi:MAG: glucose-6-phosphate isomerase, partial [Eubacteriales bacterium]|nr:glucose-6-phosphate isomerase [Eubacteriales bacterium]
MRIKIDEKYLKNFLTEDDIRPFYSLLEPAHDKIMNNSGEGSEFLGWRDQPESPDLEEIKRIKAAAEKIKNNSDVLIVIGIGGSYLGARAVIELLKSPFYNSM